MTRELSRAALGAAAEATLAALAIAGDDPAFGELVRRHHSRIRSLLRRLGRDPVLADDLAQQAFVQAWRRIRTLRTPGAFPAWLRQIAVSTWLQQLRAQGSRDADAPNALGAEPAHEPTLAERMDLDRALSHLGPHVRLCIVLAYGERMSHREIAETTELPLGTVKSHIARGASRLRDLLQAYETKP